MTVSLYRKYRPSRFEDVVGQTHVTRTLVNAIRQDRVSHAYLFAGPRGTGKTTTARILAMALNCESGRGKATTEPDGTCPHCDAIRRGNSLDVVEIDAASNRGIDEIRDLRDRVQFAPVEGRMKVYIVDEVHMLTPEAFNALLKMLEEPPPHVVFVLATTEPHKILPTILSRCQRFDFRRPSLAEIVRVLALVAAQEDIEVTENTLSVIARAAGGSFRDAIGTLDQLSAYCEGAVTLQDALALLGVAQQDLLFELVDVVDDRDTQAALLFVERLTQAGTDLNQFLKDMLGHLRDLYVVQHTLEPPASIGTSEEHLDQLRSQANRVSTALLVDFIDLVGEAQRSIRQAADPRLELELTLIRLTRPETDLSVRGLAARLERLESGLGATTHPLGAHVHPALAGHATAGDHPTAPSHPTQSPYPAPVPPASPHVSSISAADRLATVEGQAGKDEDPDPHGTAAEEALPDSATRETATAAAPAFGHVEANIENIRRAWPVLLGAVKRERPSLPAFLNEGRPESLEGDTLVIKFPHGMEFHVSQVTRPDNAAFLSGLLREMTGRDLHIQAHAGGAAADEPAPPKEGARLTAEELVELVKLEFDAQIIDEGT